MGARSMLALAAGCLLVGTALGANDTAVSDRLTRSSQVFREMLGGSGIPPSLLRNAQCVIVVPGIKKGAFIVGGEYGSGFASCRNGSQWSAPAAVQITGGSLGAQIGAKKTDIVAFLMDPKARDQLLQSNLTLGANLSVEAGPTGRAASTDNADVLIWTRSNGAFAQAAVNGATLKADGNANRALYGQTMSERQILSGQVQPPPAAAGFLDTLKNSNKP